MGFPALCATLGVLERPKLGPMMAPLSAWSFRLVMSTRRALNAIELQRLRYEVSAFHWGGIMVGEKAELSPIFGHVAWIFVFRLDQRSESVRYIPHSFTPSMRPTTLHPVDRQ
jgi:hypothetical protein